MTLVVVFSFFENNTSPLFIFHLISYSKSVIHVLK